MSLKKKLLIFISSILGVILVAGGIYTYNLYSSVKETVVEMHEPIEREVKAPKPVITEEKKEPISILLMGVDERANDRGRSDTLIVMTLNPNKESMQMLSIQRDIRTEIIGRGTVDKINHAYAFGGTKMSIETVENFTGIPIDYYVKVNMEALVELVDSVGGITVNNPLDWTEGGFHFKQGMLELDGTHALVYSRMRKKDPRGDFGRNTRQRQVIEAIINKGASVSSVTKFDDILAALGNNVKTDLTFDEMMDLQKNYRNVRNNIINYDIETQGTMINGISYQLVSEEEKQHIHNLLAEHLEMTESSEQTANAGE
jgi:polyisoprenyl-teichoic acid--peptidoglycan teichoic acid transferase